MSQDEFNLEKCFQFCPEQLYDFSKLNIFRFLIYKKEKFMVVGFNQRQGS